MSARAGGPGDDTLYGGPGSDSYFYGTPSRRAHGFGRCGRGRDDGKGMGANASGNGPVFLLRCVV